MNLAPRRTCNLRILETSPFRSSNTDCCSTEVFENRISKSRKVNIKIGTHKLPKDFFSTNPSGKSIHKRNNTDREPFRTLNYNETPKFKEPNNKASRMKSIRVLENHDCREFSFDNNVSKIEFYDVFRPFREPLSQLKILKQCSSRKKADDDPKLQSLNT